MIKFFRKVRQQFIESGQLRKYLLYAIGELLLVVAGILIALSINNWNNNIIKRHDEVHIYENIKNQFLADKNEILRTSHYNQIYLAEYTLAFQILKSKDFTQIDTLIRIAPHLFRYSDISRSGHVYQALVNSGELKLLNNPEIIDRIQELEETYIYMNRMEENHFKVILQYVGPGLLDNIDLSGGQVQNPDILFSIQIKNLFEMFISISREKDEIYRRAIHEIDSIIVRIDNEVNQ